MKRIGIIGLGLLGSAVASRLLQGKFEVKGYDIRPERLKALEVQGLIAARTLAEVAAEVDAIFTILPSLESVENAFLGAGGLIETAPRSCTLIQMSTISPDLTRRLAKTAETKGLGFLDTPMSGTSAMVERGDCAIFVAGDRGRAAACRPIFDAIAKKTHYVGEVGMASLAKLATNLLVGLNTAALAEALVLGAKGGLAPAVLLDILKESAAASKMVDVRGPLMVSHRFDAQMKIDLFLKDFKLMLEEGFRLGVPLPLTSVTQQLATATAAAGRGEEDLAAIVTTLERLAGLEQDRPLLKKE
ncbi:MAG TPA: NAD(P)-dependent oxidoreductase [Candidatus Binatia bacterium]|jgi:3-hydroxyisobutyrate dehydrogenase-like beta-hydroxyacid dehydrogenase|nr:NAD(P)-dependent oxidoreductase [Candidatus Binatia bacterium]